MVYSFAIYMAKPSKEKSNIIAKRYQDLRDLPNCIGSIDDKHIRIKAPENYESAFYNYKGFFSVVLMATEDADGKFIIIDVGEYGRNSNGRIYKECFFGQQLIQKKIGFTRTINFTGRRKLTILFILFCYG